MSIVTFLNESISKTKTPSQKKFDLMFSDMGGSYMVVNKLKEKNGDYDTVASVSRDGSIVKYYGTIPDDVKKQVQEFADGIVKKQPRKKLTSQEETVINKGKFTVSVFGKNSDGERIIEKDRKIIIKDNRVYYFENDIQLDFTHSIDELKYFLLNRIYELK